VLEHVDPEAAKARKETLDVLAQEERLDAKEKEAR